MESANTDDRVLRHSESRAGSLRETQRRMIQPFVDHPLIPNGVDPAIVSVWLPSVPSVRLLSPSGASR